MPIIFQKLLSYFSSNKSRAITEGIITLEEYLKIPLNERKSMKCLFSPSGRQAISEGVITLEQYLQIPSGDRDSMECLFSSDGRQAVAEGVITLKQYLQISSDDRSTMRYLFSPYGRQAVADRFITFKQYLQIPLNKRWSMQFLFLPEGREAIADGVITFERYLQIPAWDKDIGYLFLPEVQQAIIDGIITLEQYLEIPSDERKSMEYLFSFHGRRAIVEGIVTLERYLQISEDDRGSMEYLFSHKGRQAVAEGIITLERYLQVPRNERRDIDSMFPPGIRQALVDNVITFKQYLQIPGVERYTMEALFSFNGRQAMDDGIITFERYLQIPVDERWYMQYLLSSDGRQAIADGIITLDQYLQIPSRERQNTMLALQYPDVRQRIINGQITIENIIDLYPVFHPIDDVVNVTANFNGKQSTHTASVHHSVSESVTRLVNRYQLEIEAAGLESIIKKAQTYIENLPNDSEKNTAAKRGFLRIIASNYNFTDPTSRVSTRQLLALFYLAIHDGKNRHGDLEDAEIQFVEALYEIQRGYNLSESGIDQGGLDVHICAAGTFNKFIEKLQGIHPDCQIQFVTRKTASFKLPIVTREETIQYLQKFTESNTDEALIHLIRQIKKSGVEAIWKCIKVNIVTRMFDEFGSLYQDINDPDFVALVEAGKDIELEDLNVFHQEEIQSCSYLNEYSTTGDLETQREDVISSKETFLAEVVEDLKLNNLEIYQQEEVQSCSYLNEDSPEGLEINSEDAISQKISIYAQIDMQLNELENKAKNLRDRDYILAYCKASNIVYLLRDLNHNYFIKKKFNSKFYKEKALDIINQERPELDKHRGFKQILGNLLILITTVGTGQLLNKACTGNFLFFKTNSAKYIDELCHTIKKLEFTLLA